MPISPEAALAQIELNGDAERAIGAKAYHKTDRMVLGCPNPVLNDLTRAWRAELDVEQRVTLAAALWDMNILETRIAAAKLLTQARIKQDDAVWDLILSWAPDFDGWAIADHACMAGQKRLVAHKARIEDVAAWTQSEDMWTKRAALIIALPFAKMNHPKAEDLAIRERVLDWAAAYVEDRAWFIQKAVAWWIRDLSKHDAARAQAFLDAHGARLKAFARKEASKYLAN